MEDLILICTSVIVGAILTTHALNDAEADSTNFPHILLYSTGITAIVSLFIFLILRFFIYEVFILQQIIPIPSY